MRRAIAVIPMLVAIGFVGCGEQAPAGGAMFDAAGVGSVEDAAAAGDDAAAAACGVVVAVQITGGDALTRPWSDLRLEGQGFEAYEGREVHLKIGSVLGPLDLSGQATATVACGGFVFLASEVLESGVPKNIVLYVDDDDDGGCDGGRDSVWSQTTSATGGDLEIVMTADDPVWHNGTCWQSF